MVQLITWPPKFLLNSAVEITTFSINPTGRNINLNCGSQHTEALAAKYCGKRPTAGFAFDGDGDRVIAVDDKGNILTGDRMLAICSVYLKKEDDLKNNLVVRTGDEQSRLDSRFQKLGIDSVFAMWRQIVLEENARTRRDHWWRRFRPLIFCNTTPPATV